MVLVDLLLLFFYYFIFYRFFIVFCNLLLEVFFDEFFCVVNFGKLVDFFFCLKFFFGEVDEGNNGFVFVGVLFRMGKLVIFFFIV